MNVAIAAADATHHNYFWLIEEAFDEFERLPTRSPMLAFKMVTIEEAFINLYHLITLLHQRVHCILQLIYLMRLKM